MGDESLAELVESSEENEEQEQEKESNLSPVEEMAAKDGWVPREQWVEDGNPEAEWRSAEVFVERGEWINRFKSVQRDSKAAEDNFNQRLAGMAKLHEAQQKVAIDDLKRQFKDAVDVADTEKAMEIQGQIEEASKPAPPTPAAPAPENPVIREWRDRNPWVLDKDNPKAVHAQLKFREFQESGMSVEEAIPAVDAFIKEKYPAGNPNRNNAHRVEGGSKPGMKRAAKNRPATWESLNATEKRIWDECGDAWKTKDDYLQAVADDRSRV